MILEMLGIVRQLYKNRIVGQIIPDTNWILVSRKNFTTCYIYCVYTPWRPIFVYNYGIAISNDNGLFKTELTSFRDNWFLEFTLKDKKANPFTSENVQVIFDNTTVHANIGKDAFAKGNKIGINLGENLLLSNYMKEDGGKQIIIKTENQEFNLSFYSIGFEKADSFAQNY